MMALPATVLRVAVPTVADVEHPVATPRVATPRVATPRVVTHGVVDEWGRDGRLIHALAPLAHLRWDVSVTGAELLRRNGALIIVNTRRFALTPIAAAWALSAELDRPVRFVGRPDIVPFGPLLRRSGGLLAQPAEIAGALRAGELVIIGAASTTTSGHAGRIDAALVAPAISENVAVHVAAAASSMTSRHVHIQVSPPLRPGRLAEVELAEVELAETARRRLQDLLDEPPVRCLTGVSG